MLGEFSSCAKRHAEIILPIFHARRSGQRDLPAAGEAHPPVTGHPGVVVPSNRGIGMPSSAHSVPIAPCIRGSVAQSGDAMPRESAGATR